MKLVIASGYFNPLGSHHLSYLKTARELGDGLIVIVNNDEQVKLKGSIPFQNQYHRCEIVQSLKFVDGAIISLDNTKDISISLSMLYGTQKDKVKQFIFANGGDSTPNPEEVKVCNELGIEMVFGVGGKKTGSSSNLIEKAVFQYIKQRGWTVVQ